MPIVGQFGSLAGMGSLVLPGGAMESIATVTVGSNSPASVEFLDIPSNYQHLELRWIARIGRSATNGALRLYVNNTATSSQYAAHRLYGNGSSAGADGYANHANNIFVDRAAGSTASASMFGAGIIDILDYANTSKATTVRNLGGVDLNGSGEVYVESGLWTSTNAVDRILLEPVDTPKTFAQYSQFSLYGLRAP